MKFANTHQSWQDRFRILTFHRDDVKTLEELDEHLTPVIQEVWEGQPLPFPILLDATGETIRRFGVRWYPTEIFIDPTGKIVRGMDLEKLAARLADGPHN